jgi:membrane associated rhomboid family serine protease
VKDNVPRRGFPLLTAAAGAAGASAWLASLLHGGALQLILCLAALAIFGQSVEDALGRASFAALGLLGGIVALGATLLAGSHSAAITLACAGAVAAVLGAHLALHPRARVLSVLFAPLFSTVVAVPAIAVIALWLALQVPLGLGFDEPLASDGAAWFAHLGAIFVGLAAARALARRSRLQAQPAA